MSWQRPNIGKTLALARSRTNRADIRARNQKRLEFPSFYLELTVIEALRYSRAGTLSARVAASAHGRDVVIHVRLRPGVGLPAVETVVAALIVLSFRWHTVYVVGADADVNRHVLLPRRIAGVLHRLAERRVYLLECVRRVRPQRHEEVEVRATADGRAFSERTARCQTD
jgi:hypothetical protein